MADFALTHISRSASRLGFLAARPRIAATLCIVAFTTLGFAILAAGEASGVLAAICRPGTGSVNAAVVLALWCAMTLAMMLPTAAPMILTYAEIAEVAARKGEPIVSPFALAAGYAAVWAGFAAVVAGMQTGLSGWRLEPAMLTWLSGATFIAAGAYQFTSVKHACLHRCRQPFQFFFTNWATTAPGVFRLGLRQGAYCLGCCWALMALMFTAGTLNILWMTMLATIMTLEKMTRSAALPNVIGVLTIAAGVAILLL